MVAPAVPLRHVDLPHHCVPALAVDPLPHAFQGFGTLLEAPTHGAAVGMVSVAAEGLAAALASAVTCAGSVLAGCARGRSHNLAQ